MSFIEGFITFELSINNSVREEYTNLKLRIAKHPLESIQNICARIICFTHAYKAGLKFSEFPNSQESPTMINLDASNAVIQWIHVGKLNESTLRQAVKHYPDAEVECYFTQNGNIDHFCHQLRGSKSNWVDGVVFWKMDLKLITKVSEIIEARNKWTLSIVEDQVYINTGSTHFTGSAKGINIWDEYQEHLNTTTLEI
ncbi:MAG: YaeQ family protein [Bdellovibrionota bacterium]